MSCGEMSISTPTPEVTPTKVRLVVGVAVAVYVTVAAGVVVGAAMVAGAVVVPVEKNVVGSVAARAVVGGSTTV